MKKIILTTVLAMGALTISNAQEISFGAKAGGQLANLVGDDTDNLKGKIAGYGGVFANIGLTNEIYIQPELLFSMQGAKGDDLDISIRYNYLNIPVMFQYKLTDEIYAELGPQLGVLLSAEVENNEVFLTADTKDITKTVDFGLNVGAGYIMENGLGFNIRYNMGLTSVDDTDDDVDVKNSILSLGLSYCL